MHVATVVIERPDGNIEQSSRALAGMEAPPVSVEVHLANRLPSFTIVGNNLLAHRAKCEEAISATMAGHELREPRSPIRFALYLA